MELVEVYWVDQEGVSGAVRRSVLTVGWTKNCYRQERQTVLLIQNENIRHFEQRVESEGSV